MIYQEEYKAQIEDFDLKWQLKYETIIRILENSGNRHSDLAGDSAIEGLKNGASWVFVDWNIEILHRPIYGECLYIKTWIASPTASSSISRQYVLYGKDGERLVVAASKLVLLNHHTRHLAKITPELAAKYQPEPLRIIEENKYPRLTGPLKFDYERKFSLRNTDIDFNGHLHNTLYVDFALSTLPDDVADNVNFSVLRIVYRKPIMPCASITCRYSSTECGHTVALLDGNGLTCSLVEFSGGNGL